MVVHITLLQSVLAAVALVAGSWVLGYLLLRARHLRALAEARLVAERLRRPAQSLAEMEAQSTALEELIHFRDTEAAVSAARALLPELDAGVRASALEVLRRTRALDRWMHDLRRGRLAARMRAVQALGEVGDERAVDALIIALGDREPDLARAAARALLVRDRDVASDRLADALSSPSPRIAEAAAAVLVEMGEEGVEPLVSQLVETSPQARRLAVEGLREIGDSTVVTALLPLLTTDPNPGVRVAVLEALTVLSRSTYHLALRRSVLSDPDAFVRARACALLAEMEAPGASEFLRWQLGEYRPLPLRQGEYQEELAAAAEDDSEVVRAILLGLRKLGVSEEDLARPQPDETPVEESPVDVPEGEPSADARELPLLAAWLEARDAATRAEAVRELSALGPRVAAHLRPALRDPDPVVRAEAARALGRIGGVSALKGLGACLQDPDQEVRLAVAGAVRAIVTRDAAREPL